MRASGPLVEGFNGNFYGTTGSGGGSSVCPDGCGTVFEITPGGQLTTLHSFTDTDGHGNSPGVGLVQATNGNFYRTTVDGGTNGDYGTVFSLGVWLGPFVETLPTSGKVGAAVIILGNNLTGATPTRLRVRFWKSFATISQSSSVWIRFATCRCSAR